VWNARLVARDKAAADLANIFREQLRKAGSMILADRGVSTLATLMLCPPDREQGDLTLTEGRVFRLPSAASTPSSKRDYQTARILLLWRHHCNAYCTLQVLGWVVELTNVVSGLTRASRSAGR
jgi:hypothetical protein